MSQNNMIVVMPWAMSEILRGSMNAEKLIANITYRKYNSDDQPGKTS